MTHEQIYRRVLNPREQVLYQQHLEKLESSTRRQYEDPEFLRRFHQYIVSKEAYAKALREACDIFFKETQTTKELELKDPGRKVAPQQKETNGQINLNAPNFYAPMTELNLSQLFILRRFYERDAYNYFQYDFGLKQSRLRPITRRRNARNHMKDASTAMSFGRSKRADMELENAQREINVHCQEIWALYENSSKPRSQEIIKNLADALGMAQAASVDSPSVDKISNEISRLISSGKFKKQ